MIVRETDNNFIELLAEHREDEKALKVITELIRWCGISGIPADRIEFGVVKRIDKSGERDRALYLRVSRQLVEKGQ